METNNIINEEVIDAAEEAVKTCFDTSFTKGTALGVALVATGIIVWKYGAKPAIRKLKAWKAKKEEETLESYINTDENYDKEESAEDEKNDGND